MEILRFIGYGIVIIAALSISLNTKAYNKSQISKYCKAMQGNTLPQVPL